MASASVKSRPQVTIPQRPTRRAKATVSYRENEDEDGEEEEAERPYKSDSDNDAGKPNNQSESEGEYTAPATRCKRASPQRSSRQSPAKRSVITIDDSEEEEMAQDDDQIEGEGEYAAPTTTRKRKSPSRSLRKSRSKKRRRAAPIKREISERREFSDLSASDSNTESEDDKPIFKRAMQKKPAQTRTTRGRARGRLAQESTSQALDSSRALSVDHHSEGKIPDWKTLPYHVMLNIMSLVGGPLADERDFRATENFKSVFNASQVCRSWSEAALTILWQDPVLIPMERAHL